MTVPHALYSLTSGAAAIDRTTKGFDPNPNVWTQE